MHPGSFESSLQLDGPGAEVRLYPGLQLRHPLLVKSASQLRQSVWQGILVQAPIPPAAVISYLAGQEVQKSGPSWLQVLQEPSQPMGTHLLFGLVGTASLYPEKHWVQSSTVFPSHLEQLAWQLASTQVPTPYAFAEVRVKPDWQLLH